MAKLAYRFHLTDPLTTSARAIVGEIPGAFIKERLVVAPLNCAWLVENTLRQLNLLYKMERPKPRRVYTLDDIRAISELRDWVPDFLAKYQNGGVLRVANGPSESGILSHPTGCLTGDTELIINRGGCARRIRLDELVFKFNGGPSKARRTYRWDPAIPTMTQSLVDGFVRLNQITAAYESGVKEVFEVVTQQGRRLRATADHRFLTSNDHLLWRTTPDCLEWHRLAELTPGDVLIVTEDAGGAKRARKPQSLQTQVKHHPQATHVDLKRSDAWCDKRGYTRGYVEHIARVPTHRLVVEADINHLTLEAYLLRLRAGDLAGLVFLDPTLHVHHRDLDTKNNARVNLEVMTEEDHQRSHGLCGGWKHVTARGVADQIISIKSCGPQMTYDLSMAAPHNNFVANGIVVHNSGKSLSGIVWGLLQPGTIIYVTKAAARRTIQLEVQRYTTVQPLVLWPPSDKRYDPEPLEAIHEQRIVIVAWDSLPSMLSLLLRVNATSVVWDELHRGKGHKRNQAIPGRDDQGNDIRTFKSAENIVAAAARIARNVKRRMGTTATMVPDRTRDLWGQLDLVHPGEWGTYWGVMDEETDTRLNSFTKRYCDLSMNDFGGWDERGFSNVDELKKRLSFVVHRVDSSVTHRDLPEKRRQIVYLTKADQNAPGAFTEELRKAQKSGAKTLREVRLAEAASRKRDYIKDDVLEAVRSKQKVVIFTGRHRDCDRLQQAITKAVGPDVPVFVAHGGHGTAHRDAIQEQWMGNIVNPNAGPPLEGPAVLIATAQSMGESVSLHDTDLALFAMLPINAKELWQSEGRFHRRGQRKSVLIKHIVAEGTYDEIVNSILLSKLPAVADIQGESQFVEAADQFLKGGLDASDIERKLLDMVNQDPDALFAEFEKGSAA